MHDDQIKRVSTKNKVDEERKKRNFSDISFKDTNNKKETGLRRSKRSHKKDFQDYFTWSSTSSSEENSDLDPDYCLIQTLGLKTDEIESYKDKTFKEFKPIKSKQKSIKSKLENSGLVEQKQSKINHSVQSKILHKKENPVKTSEDKTCEELKPIDSKPKSSPSKLEISGLVEQNPAKMNDSLQGNVLPNKKITIQLNNKEDNRLQGVVRVSLGRRKKKKATIINSKIIPIKKSKQSENKSTKDVYSESSIPKIKKDLKKEYYAEKNENVIVIESTSSEDEN